MIRRALSTARRPVARHHSYSYPGVPRVGLQSLRNTVACAGLSSTRHSLPTTSARHPRQPSTIPAFPSSRGNASARVDNWGLTAGRLRNRSTSWATRSPSGIRSFHATSRREALPLLPAVGALLKSTSLLALVTGFSRVLISFFPIGTLATFRLARGVTWLAKDKRVPKASPDADEFYKMWCEDEKGVRVTPAEATALVHAPETPHEGLLAPDGRIAYSVPLPRNWRQRHDPGTKPDAEDSREHAKWERKTQRRIRKMFYFLPDLPPASVKYYNELSLTEREEVDALRRYWISLRMFKDRLKLARWFVATLIGIPVLMLLCTLATGLERVPFTGRWRLILLTADEEEAITQSLQGANWFKSVISLLTTEEKPAPPIVPLSDWRWQWVQGTLRHLESEVVAAIERIEAGEEARPVGSEALHPPSSRYPLRPRPRASARLHAALPRVGRDDKEPGPTKQHLEVGPPYNIMLMDAPDKNAFSYGFGGQGAGGIVIFTGLLDDILSRGKPPEPPPPPPRGFWGSVFGTPPPRPQPPQPTPEQTLHLATVIAHEMGHLLLSHHLETLSLQQVLWPSVVGLSIDLLRAFIWPFTIFLGPTVNDALANLGRTSTEELTKLYGHIGFDQMHEYEADLTALRLLAHGGYDPRAAVDRFAGSLTRLEELPDGVQKTSWWALFKPWKRVHPSSTERIAAMDEELNRWVKEAAELELQDQKRREQEKGEGGE